MGSFVNKIKSKNSKDFDSNVTSERYLGEKYREECLNNILNYGVDELIHIRGEEQYEVDVSNWNRKHKKIFASTLCVDKISILYLYKSDYVEDHYYINIKYLENDEVLDYRFKLRNLTYDLDRFINKEFFAKLSYMDMDNTTIYNFHYNSKFIWINLEHVELYSLINNSKYGDFYIIESPGIKLLTSESIVDRCIEWSNNIKINYSVKIDDDVEHVNF